MTGRVERQTVNLSAFRDLVVIYLAMRVNAWTGVKTLLGFGPQIKNSVDQKPDGLLLHENFIMSLVPLHLSMRQYWRDFDALEASAPHPIAIGGATSFGRLAERGSGIKRISSAAAWRRFTTTYLSAWAWASDNSRQCSLPVDRCSQPARGPSSLVSRVPQSSKRPIFYRVPSPQ
jgi:hypothetical protein